MIFITDVSITSGDVENFKNHLIAYSFLKENNSSENLSINKNRNMNNCVDNYCSGGGLIIFQRTEIGNFALENNPFILVNSDLKILVIDSRIQNISTSEYSKYSIFVDDNNYDSSEKKVINGFMYLNITNSTFSYLNVSLLASVGGLVTLSSSDKTGVGVYNSSFSDFVFSEDVLKGGIIHISKANYVEVLSSQFIAVGEALNGGALFFECVLNPILVYDSTFDLCKSVGDGGAILFSKEVLFEILNSAFVNCSTRYGYGGGFASGSMRSGKRIIKNCSFNNNLAVFSRIGVDIYDLSAALNYNQTNVLNCSTVTVVYSENSTDVTYFGGSDYNNGYIRLDCLISDEECYSGDIYVDSVSGFDWSICGANVGPCKTLQFGIERGNVVQSVVYLVNNANGSVYHLSNIRFPRGTTNVSGLGRPSSSLTLYPTIVPDYAYTSYLFNFVEYYAYVDISYLNIKFDESVANGNANSLVYIFADYGSLYLRYALVNCIFFIRLSVYFNFYHSDFFVKGKFQS
jgi:hypothetical protein